MPFFVFGMTQPRTEPWSSGPLVHTLPTRLMGWAGGIQIFLVNKAFSNLIILREICIHAYSNIIFSQGR